ARAEEPARPDFRARVPGLGQLGRAQGREADGDSAAHRHGDALKVAALQMVSAPDLAPNLEAATRLITAAAAAGARLVALPENFYLIGRHETDKVRLREPDGSGPIQDFLSRTAREHRLWIVA